MIIEAGTSLRSIRLTRLEKLGKLAGELKRRCTHCRSATGSMTYSIIHWDALSSGEYFSISVGLGGALEGIFVGISIDVIL